MPAHEPARTVFSLPEGPGGHSVFGTARAQPVHCPRRKSARPGRRLIADGDGDSPSLILSLQERGTA
ncbi:hypothetical protein ACWD4P_26465, partial [Kitasatospora sp. NPDC002543]